MAKKAAPKKGMGKMGHMMPGHAREMGMGKKMGAMKGMRGGKGKRGK